MQRSRATFLATTALLLAAGAGFGTTAVITPQGNDWPSARESTVKPAHPKHGQQAPTSPEQRAAWLRVRSNGAASRRFPGRGWTVAHDRHMARKRRNVMKARRAGRG